MFNRSKALVLSTTASFTLPLMMTVCAWSFIGCGSTENSDQVSNTPSDGEAGDSASVPGEMSPSSGADHHYRCDSQGPTSYHECMEHSFGRSYAWTAKDQNCAGPEDDFSFTAHCAQPDVGCGCTYAYALQDDTEQVKRYFYYPDGVSAKLGLDNWMAAVKRFCDSSRNAVDYWFECWGF